MKQLIQSANKMYAKAICARETISKELNCQETYDEILETVFNQLNKIILKTAEIGGTGVTIGTTVDSDKSEETIFVRFVLFNCAQLFEDVKHYLENYGYTVSQIKNSEDNTHAYFTVDWDNVQKEYVKEK